MGSTPPNGAHLWSPTSGCAIRSSVRLRRFSSLLGLSMALAIPLGPAGCRLKTEQPPAAVERVAPELGLPAHDGSTVELADLVANGPAIIVFYRGHW